MGSVRSFWKSGAGGVNLTLPRRSRGEQRQPYLRYERAQEHKKHVFVLPIGQIVLFALPVHILLVIYSDGNTRGQVPVAKHFLCVSWIFLKGEDIEVQEPL